MSRIYQLLLSFCLLCIFTVKAQPNMSELNGTSWSGIQYGLFTGEGILSSDNFRDSLFMVDFNLKFIEDECSPTWGVVRPATYVCMESRNLPLEEKDHYYTRALLKWLRRSSKDLHWYGKNMRWELSLRAGHYNVNDEYLTYEIPRAYGKVYLSDKCEYKPQKHSAKTIEGLWNFGDIKLLLLEKLPKGIALNEKENKSKHGYIFTIADDGTLANGGVMSFLSEKDSLLIHYGKYLVVKMPYQLSDDGTKLQIKLKRNKEFVKKRSVIDRLKLTSIDDSLYLMDNYLRLKNDSLLNSPSIQQHKKDLQKIVNIIYRNEAYNDSVDIDYFPGYTIISRYDKCNSKADSYQIECSSYFVCLNEKGDTVTKKMEEYQGYGMTLGSKIASVKNGFSSNPKYKHHYSDIVLEAFNFAIDHQKEAEINQFLSETKQGYINSVLTRYGVVSTKADSVSFASGFLAGKQLADSVQVERFYDFVDGLNTGYQTKDFGKLDWLNMLSIIKNKPQESLPAYMLGFHCGEKGSKAKLNATYVAGCYYGISKAKVSWTEKELEDYQKMGNKE